MPGEGPTRNSVQVKRRRENDGFPERTSGFIKGVERRGRFERDKKRDLKQQHSGEPHKMCVMCSPGISCSGLKCGYRCNVAFPFEK